MPTLIKLILTLALTLALTAPVGITVVETPFSGPEMAWAAKKKSSSISSSKKTQKVSGYTTKSGKKVDSYKRRPPR